jgi:hypothetical protein
MATRVLCDLEHDRAPAAALRIVITSNRVDRPGRPMIRELMVCPAHARQLRQLGFEVISTS